MGLIRDFREFQRERHKQPVAADVPAKAPSEENSYVNGTYSVYENNSITVRGEPLGYCFADLLRDPQGRIYDLYALALYYKNADPYVGAAISNVYVPFSVAKDYQLVGVSEETKEKYLAHYKRIGFNRLLSSIFDQYYTFQNVFVYLMPDGTMFTLPPQRCRISEVQFNGEPVVEFDRQGMFDEDILHKTGKAREKYIKAVAARMKGVPPEILPRMEDKSFERWVQLNPDNIFAAQAPKPDWQRYAVPTIAQCLPALGRKALINDYVNAQLRFGIKGFLHVQVGDKDKDAGVIKPDRRHLESAAQAFNQGLRGGQQVVTPWYCKAQFITVDTSTLFDKDKYAEVNREILSAYGISGVISMGQQEAGSYGQAKLSLDTAALRIEWAQSTIEQMMRKVNERLAKRLSRVSIKDIPDFQFPHVDLTRDGSFAEAVYKLWMQGMVSDRTLLDTYELDIAQESERRTVEKRDGTEELFSPRQNAYTSNTTSTASSTGEGQAGRPALSDNERSSDPANSSTGAQPKPSNSRGSGV